MKSSRLVTLLLAASLCQVAPAVVTYSTTFNGLTTNTDLEGQDGWFLTGAASGGGGSFVTGSPFTAGSLGNIAQFGVFDVVDDNPGIARLGHAVDLPLNGAQFDVLMAITDSTPNFPKRDTFGFYFNDGGGSELFSLRFAPTTQVGDPSVDIRTDNWSWSNPNTGPSADFASLNEGQNTTIDLSFSRVSQDEVTFTLATAGTVLLNDVSIVQNGIGDASIAEFGALWEPLDTADEGDNSLLIEDISLVPEPSALLLGLLGGGLLLRRRRL